jgi:hypothetical protein
MHRLGKILTVVGIAAIVVGLLGLLSLLLQKLGVEFAFVVAPWYGPFLGGVLLVGIGVLLRRRPSQPDR